MTFDSASGLAIVVCLVLLVFGLVKRFPWFIIQGALVNGAMVVLCIYLLSKIITNIDFLGGIGALVLALVVLALGAICCFNLRAHISGKEAEHFYGLVRERLLRRDSEND
jgi:hypothetical protein